MKIAHIPVYGRGRVLPVRKNRVVRYNRYQGGAIHGAGNLEKLKQALEKLQLRNKKYVKF